MPEGEEGNGAEPFPCVPRPQRPRDGRGGKIGRKVRRVSKSADEKARCVLMFLEQSRL